MSYSEALSHYMEKAGMSVIQLSNKIGMRRSTIYALLDGRAKEPKLSTAKAIADALGTTMEEMAAMAFNDDEE